MNDNGARIITDEESVKAQYDGLNAWEQHLAIVDMTTKKPVLSVASETGTLPVDLVSSYNPKRGYKWRNRGKCVVRMSCDMNLPDELTDSDIGKLYKLARCVHYISGTLTTRGKFNVPLKSKDIAKELNISESVSRKYIAKLKALDIIRQDENRCYYINPLYFSPSYVNKELFMLWKDQIERFIPLSIRLVFSGIATEGTGYIPEFKEDLFKADEENDEGSENDGQQP